MMEYLITITGIGLIAILLLRGMQLFSRDLKAQHKDIRRIIELLFWSARREKEIQEKMRRKI